MQIKDQIGLKRYNLWVVGLLGLLCCVFASRLWLIDNFISPMPYSDQWLGEAAQIYLPWIQQTLGFSDLFQTFNNHRPALSRLVHLGLFEFNLQWDPLLAMISSNVLYTLSILLVVVINIQFYKKNPLLIALTILFLAALPFAWENTLWGFQTAWYILLFCTLFGFWWCLAYKANQWQWWLGIVITGLAFFNLASGLLGLWVITVLLLYRGWVQRQGIDLLGAIFSFCLGLAFLLLIDDAQNLGYLRAQNSYEFGLALSRNLAWPWIHHPWLALIMYLPGLLLITQVLRYRHCTFHSLWIIALGLWAVGNALGIAYARGRFGDWPHSRYMDILAMGCLANLLAALYVYNNPNLLPGWLKRPRAYFGLWLILFYSGLGLLTLEVVPHILENNRDTRHLLQESRVFLQHGQRERFIQQKIPLPTDITSDQYLDLLSNTELKPYLPAALQGTQALIAAENSGFELAELGIAHTMSSEHKANKTKTSRFVSGWIYFNQSKVKLPVTGDLAHPDINLSIEHQAGNKIQKICPQLESSKDWQICWFDNPGEKFRLILQNSAADAWFGFAPPRGVGWMSYSAAQLLSYSSIIFYLGGLLFFLFLPYYKHTRKKVH